MRTTGRVVGYFLALQAVVTTTDKTLKRRVRRTINEIKDLGKQDRKASTEEMKDANKIRTKIYSVEHLAKYYINLGTLGYFVLPDKKDAFLDKFIEIAKEAEDYNKNAEYLGHNTRLKFSYILIDATDTQMSDALIDFAGDKLDRVEGLLRAGEGKRVLDELGKISELPGILPDESGHVLLKILSKAEEDAQRLKRVNNPVSLGETLDLSYLEVEL